MNYKKTESEIVESTKEFATINNIHYDELTESMILNAMRELNKSYVCDRVNNFDNNRCINCGVKVGHKCERGK